MLLPDFLTTGRASCTSAPRLFDSNQPTNTAAAVQLCHACPLLTAYRTWAVEQREPYGTWGGLTATDRLQHRAGPGWWMDDEDRERQPCGTAEALGAHHGYGETCAVCEGAERARVAAQRRAQLAVEHARPRAGSRRGHDLHVLLGEEPCVPCTDADRIAAAGRATKARHARAGAVREQVAA